MAAFVARGRSSGITTIMSHLSKYVIRGLFFVVKFFMDFPMCLLHGWLLSTSHLLKKLYHG